MPSDKSSPPRTSSPAEADKSLVDWERLTCVLCRRAFLNQDTLQKHLQLSSLHKVCVCTICSCACVYSHFAYVYRVILCVCTESLCVCLQHHCACVYSVIVRVFTVVRVFTTSLYMCLQRHCTCVYNVIVHVFTTSLCVCRCLTIFIL